MAMVRHSQHSRMESTWALEQGLKEVLVFCKLNQSWKFWKLLASNMEINLLFCKPVITRASVLGKN